MAKISTYLSLACSAQVSCEAPLIQNGVINLNVSQEYDEPLTITCNEGVRFASLLEIVLALSQSSACFVLTRWLGQYRPNTQNAQVNRERKVKCSDSCSYSPDVVCIPVAAGTELYADSFGNASYLGLDTWKGDLPASMTGEEILQDDNSTLIIKLSFGGRATFQCSIGFIASGNTSHCTRYLYVDAIEGGILRGMNQSCQPEFCDGAAIAHVKHVVPNRIELGKNGTVTCKDGYRVGLKGQSYASCENRTNYTIYCAGCDLQAEVECIPVRCDAAGSIAMDSSTLSVVDSTLSVEQDLTNIIFPQVVHVTCNSGYRMGTHDARGPLLANGTCTQYCKLSRNLTCLHVWCNSSHLPGVNSAWAVAESGANGMYYGDTAKVKCNDGYTAAPSACVRSFMVGCASDGSIWNQSKVCNHSITCTAADDANGVITSDMSSPGARSFLSPATVTCNFGHGARTWPATYAPCNSSTNYTATCSNNCTFAGSQKCLPHRCPLSDVASALAGTGIYNHSLVGAYAYFGDTVTITCNSGYVFGSETSRIKMLNANCSANACGSFGLDTSTSLCVQLKCNLTSLVSEMSCSLLSISFPRATLFRSHTPLKHRTEA